MKTHAIIPIFLPELGCPKQCVFCNQQHISGQQYVPGFDEVKASIGQHLTTMKAKQHIELAFFGGSFTALPLELQESYLQIAAPYIESKQISSIRISTRPDAIDHHILNMLKSYGVGIIELGVQSMDDEVLRLSGRGYQAGIVREAARLINEYNFTLGMQMMIGLPGDTPEKAIMTAREIVRLGAQGTRIYPLLVFRDTELELQYNKGSYVPLSVENAVAQAADILEIFEQAGITVYKIGLHPSDFLHNGDWVAGPWIPDFRQHVQALVWQRRFLKELQSKGTDMAGFRVNASDQNSAIGPKRSNIQFFEQKGLHITIEIDNKVKKGDFYAFYR
ncbi:MAG: radical SAM protein [Bacteroidetes bacterium HGW-Bacteroidetes-6]|jgi:histone acetyltransferase (RNA polymerase elongator complex component)|nr:MAG: radical SAM protein [Bacteroidetes bacterium HGW-Bacteroidetes-6]